jgi:hypothetical protein
MDSNKRKSVFSVSKDQDEGLLNKLFKNRKSNNFKELSLKLKNNKIECQKDSDVGSRKNQISSISKPSDELFKKLGITNYFQSYGFDKIKDTAWEENTGTVMLKVGNRCKKLKFEIVITGIGNPFYEKCKLNPGEFKNLILDPGQYHLVGHFEGSLIMHISNITENEEWYYKSRPGGINEDVRLVNFKSGHYSLVGGDYNFWRKFF